MEQPRTTARVSVPRLRDRAIELLSDSFANGDLELDEFERRITLAHNADTAAALEALCSGLETLQVQVEQAAPMQIVPAAHAPERSRALAIMGGAARGGGWVVPRLFEVTCIMGGAELDFRDAQLALGVTEVRIFALMGGANLIVPPGLAVEAHGTSIMGGFSDCSRVPRTPDPGSPVLRVTGLCIMGGVNIETRLRKTRSTAPQLEGKAGAPPQLTDGQAP